jgi:thiamine-monophosphate kinase
MSERDWIDRYIRPLVSAGGADALRDDVAMLTSGSVQIVTMDTLVEGVHFLSSDPLDTVGQKLLRVNVSDIYAKGALPLEALLSVAWPKGRRETEFAALMSGVGRDLAMFKVALIGGDFVSTDGPLVLTLALTGSCLGAGPIRRSGARVGDSIFIGGEIGWGAVGLAAARDGGSVQDAGRYRVPSISTAAQARTVCDSATASMDVSDGLLFDAQRLAQASGLGLVIALDAVPLAGDVTDLEDIIRLCSGGDDYQILMTTRGYEAPDGFTKIGIVTAGNNLALTYKNEPVNLPETLGFEH